MVYPDQIYELAFALRDIAPWKMMGDLQVFAFISRSTGQDVYCIFTGYLGEYIALDAYVGEEGLQDLYQMAEMGKNLSDYPADEFNPDLVYQSKLHNMLQCGFFSAAEVPREQLATVKDYAKKNGKTLTGKQDIPTFMDYYPLYQESSVKEGTGWTC